MVTISRERRFRSDLFRSSSVDGTDAVVVEVKSELKTDDVRERLDRLRRFKKLFRPYPTPVMGALAMVVPDGTVRFAHHTGLFVPGQNGDAVTMRNDAMFEPAV